MHPDAVLPVLLACDHASDRFPRALGDLGLDAFARRCHLALDIGAGPLTEYLADSLGATAVLAQLSPEAATGDIAAARHALARAVAAQRETGETRFDAETEATIQLLCIGALRGDEACGPFAPNATSSGP